MADHGEHAESDELVPHALARCCVLADWSTAALRRENGSTGVEGDLDDERPRDDEARTGSTCPGRSPAGGTWEIVRGASTETFPARARRPRLNRRYPVRGNDAKEPPRPERNPRGCRAGLRARRARRGGRGGTRRSRRTLRRRRTRAVRASSWTQAGDDRAVDCERPPNAEVGGEHRERGEGPEPVEAGESSDSGHAGTGAGSTSTSVTRILPPKDLDPPAQRDAMSRSTRSSFDLNGSLHNTVRCAWSLSFRCTQSTV